MTFTSSLRAVAGALFVVLLHLAPAQAQWHTFVASHGSDNNSCTLASAPCRSLAEALAKTSAGGKVFILTAGEFGAITITRSVSIVAVGVDANLHASSVHKITVDAGADDIVYLEGLSVRGIIGSGSSLANGIRFLRGKALHLRNCTIQAFGNAGLLIEAPGPSDVLVSDCTIVDNKYGVWANQSADSSAVHVLLDRVTIARNSQAGVHAAGRRMRVRLNNTTITANNKGLQAASGGRLISFGNNTVTANKNNGAPNQEESRM